MIDSAKYLANQINGPVAHSLLQGNYDLYDQYASYLEYLTNCKLETGYISTSDLDYLGEVLAISRPYIVGGTDNTLLLSIASYPYPEGWRVAHAMTDANNPISGGLLGSASNVYSIQSVSDAVYLRYLRDGVTLRKTQSIESLCAAIEDLISPSLGVGDDVNQYYSVAFNADRVNDIDVNLAQLFTNYAPYMQMSFNATFTTAPRVRVTIGDF